MADELKLIDTEALSHFKTKQDLENAQTFLKKADAPNLTGAVLYNAAQVLTEQQKAQARANIGIDLENLGNGGTVDAVEEIVVIIGNYDISTKAVTVSDEDKITALTMLGSGDARPLFMRLVPTGILLSFVPSGYVFMGVDEANRRITVTVSLIDESAGFAPDNLTFTYNREQIIMRSNVKDSYDEADTGDLLSKQAISTQLIRMLNDLGVYDDVVEGYYCPEDYYYEDMRGKFYEQYINNYEYKGEISGEVSKLYIDLLTNNTYRWSGSVFVRINPDQYTVATNSDIEELFA